MSKDKKVIKAYACRVPGRRFTLPANLVDKLNKQGYSNSYLSKGNNTIKFSNKKQNFTLVEKVEHDESGHRIISDIRHNIVEIDHPEIQAFVESLPAFKGGLIYSVKTNAERQAEKKKAEQAANLEKYRDMKTKGILKIDSDTPDETIRSIAKEIGVDTTIDGKKAKKDEIITGILQKLE